MKNKTIYTIIFFIVCAGVLSGCTLFPLREEADISVDQNAQEPTEPTEPETTDKVKNVIKPIEIEEEGDIMYCVSPVNIRDAASSNASVIGELRTGEKVAVLSKNGSWFEISYKGRSAFVYQEYLSEKSNTDE